MRTTEETSRQRHITIIILLRWAGMLVCAARIYVSATAVMTLGLAPSLSRPSTRALSIGEMTRMIERTKRSLLGYAVGNRVGYRCAMPHRRLISFSGDLRDQAEREGSLQRLHRSCVLAGSRVMEA